MAHDGAGVDRVEERRWGIGGEKPFINVAAQLALLERVDGAPAHLRGAGAFPPIPVRTNQR